MSDLRFTNKSAQLHSTNMHSTNERAHVRAYIDDFTPLTEMPRQATPNDAHDAYLSEIFR